MSLSADERKNIWKEHADSLTRIRTQLSDKRSPVPKIRSPAGKPGRGSYSPLGRYRRSTPPYLPRWAFPTRGMTVLSGTEAMPRFHSAWSSLRLETPPDAETGLPLRGSRYETVPPVFKKRASRQSDYDSWGEESDSGEDEDQGQYMPQPYPIQPYGAPPPVVFGAPFPMFYPPPPPQRRKQRDKVKGRTEPERLKQYKRPDRDRFEDVERSVPSKSRKKNRVQFNSLPTSVYPYPTYVYPYPSFYGEQPGRKESKYKYIQSRGTPYSADLPDDNMYQRFRDDPDRLLYYYIKDHPLFGENLVDWFISQCLDEFIPDILIDVVKTGNLLDAVSPLHAVRDGIVAEELPNILHDVVKSTLNEMVNEYMLYTQLDQDPLESFLNRLVNDAVQEAATTVVKETVKGMARDYVDMKHVDDVVDDLVADYLSEIGYELVHDAVFEMEAEEFIENEVIIPDLAEVIPEIATEVLSHYDTKVMRRELKEVSKHAGDKLIESIILDYLLSTVARQGKVWSESDHADMNMDDLICTILLEQLVDVTTQRRKTVSNKPMRKLHEKAVTDIALDVLLQQLSASLDEDLLDVDEYERGITDPYYTVWSPSSKIS